MNNIICIIFTALVLGLGSQAQASNLNQHPQFVGIDSSVMSEGMVTVFYQGNIYHLTEGDTIDNVTVVLIDKTDGEVIVKIHHHLKEYKVTVK